MECSTSTRCLASGRREDLGYPEGVTYYVGELGSDEKIKVLCGFQTDFASVPRIFWWLVPKWGKYGKAAIIHDYCYWDQDYSRKRSDEIFPEAMRVLGVAPWRKFMIF